MTFDEALAGLQSRAAASSDFGHSVKFDFGDAGLVHFDGTVSPAAVTTDDKEAECTIVIALDDFAALTAGDLDPTTAFMLGKLKVKGSMGVALKLQSVLG